MQSNKNKNMYPAEIVLPMKAELVDGGFDELLTSDAYAEVVAEDD